MNTKSIKSISNINVKYLNIYLLYSCHGKVRVKERTLLFVNISILTFYSIRYFYFFTILDSDGFSKLKLFSS